MRTPSLTTIFTRIAFTLGGVGSVACGVDDIELAPSLDRPVNDARDAGDATVAARDAQATATPPVCGPTSPPTICRPLGDACGSATDCCSLRCEAGTCLSAEGGAPGAPCTARAQCASGLCEPSGARGALVCLPVCRVAGATCQRANDCCGFSCVGGVCGGSSCLREGATCSTAAQCCSNKCDKNRCALEPGGACRATGESCGPGAGGCCGACDPTSRVCDLGPGPCRVPGTVCTAPSDCCEGTCSGDAGAPRVCASRCLDDGAACRVSFECCSGACTGNPPRCEVAPQTCTRTGALCAAPTECCSGLCDAGVCQPGCTPPLR